MTEREGFVVALDGDHAVVEISAAEACGSCGKAGGCGSGDAGGRRQRIRNAVGASVGDPVVIVVPDGAVLQAALRAYILPLAFALIGVASGLTLGGDGLGALLGLVGLGVGWVLLGNVHSARGIREFEPSMRIKPAVVHLHRKQAS
jgi:positive regulator of sigma E activity